MSPVLIFVHFKVKALPRCITASFMPASAKCVRLQSEATSTVRGCERREGRKKTNRGSETAKSESVQDLPCGLMWKSTVGQLLRSRCPHIRQRWCSFHFFFFSRSLCAPPPPQSDRGNGHFLPNQFSHVPKYSRLCCMSFNVHVVNTTWCRYRSFYLQPDSFKDLRLDNVFCPRS